MGNFWQAIANNIGPIIYMLLLIGGPLLARIAKKTREAAKKRREAIERERIELERLRTGGLDPTARRAPTMDAPPQAQAQPQSARASLEEMAARRRSELERLRRQRQSGQQPVSEPGNPAGSTRASPAPQRSSPQPKAQRSEVPVDTPSSAGTTRIQLPGGIVIDVPAETAPQRPQRRQQQGQRQRQRPQRTDQRQPQSWDESERLRNEAAARQRAEAEARKRDAERTRRESEEREARLQEEEDARRRQAGARLAAGDTPEAKRPGARRTPLFPQGLNRTDLRRAIIAQEILGQPLALRERQQQQF